MAELITLAWPIAAAMAGETVIGLVDTKLVGGLGAGALAGVGIGTTLMWLGYIIVFGVLRGVKIRSAYAVGEGERASALRYAYAGLVLAAISGVVIWFVARDATWILLKLGIDARLVPYAKSFYAAVTYGAPGACLVCALTQHRQGIGDSRTPMIIGIAGNVVNASLGYCLIYGHLGLPRLGVVGAGYGTAVTESLEATALLVMLAREAHAARTTRDAARVSGERRFIPLSRALREVLSLGLPTGAQFGAEGIAFTAFTAVLGTIGAEQLAAHQAALATVRTSFLPGLAVSEAASVLVGQALGRRRLDDADRTTKAALFLAITFMAGCGVIFAVFGEGLARALTPDVETAAIMRRLLLIAAVFQVLDAVNIVLRGALRGAKDVRVPALISVGVIWLCVPTGAYLLGKLAGWGAFGGWCGFLGETTFGALFLALRWRKGAWRRAYTEAPVAAEVAGGLTAAAE